jgi:uncharacterized protein YjbJ (UPF0337 family)
MKVHGPFELSVRFSANLVPTPFRIQTTVTRERAIERIRRAALVVAILEQTAPAERYPSSSYGGNHMDWNRVEGNWKQVKGKIKEQWGKLTDDDIDQIAGKRDQLEGKIQERYGLEKDRVKTDVDDWYGRQTW